MGQGSNRDRKSLSKKKILKKKLRNFI